MLRHMSVAKVCCRLEETEVQDSHQRDLKWHAHAYYMEPQMICNHCACKQQHVAVRGKKNTGRQQQAVL
eukprot:2674132-Amphidinium_carterae.1